LKGESYQRLLNNKGLNMLSSSSTQNGSPLDNGKNFSVNNALFKSTAPHVMFISSDKAPISRSRSPSVISGKTSAVDL